MEVILVSSPVVTIFRAGENKTSGVQRDG